CTSEDINNLSYALMLKSLRDEVLLPAWTAVITDIATLAHRYAHLPMLSRTHGQPASPTTLGKEMANVVHRLHRQREQLKRVEILAQMHGAVSKCFERYSDDPVENWQVVARHFVEGLRLAFSPYTIQIDPHDYVAELFDVAAWFIAILMVFCCDVWGYSSLG